MRLNDLRLFVIVFTLFLVSFPQACVHAWDAADLVQLSRMLDGQLPPDTARYDLNSDGALSSTDLEWMLRAVHGHALPVRLDAQTIGNTGGTVGTSECQVVIPSGAWSEPAFIALHRLPETEDYQADTDAGTLYEVSGIPADATAPIEFRLSLTGFVDNVMMDIGEFAYSTGGAGWQYRAVEAIVTNNQLRYLLPPTPQGPITFSKNVPTQDPAPSSRFTADTNYVYRFRLIRYSRLTGDRFDLYFPARHRWIERYIYNVMYALEHAYSTLSASPGFGFSYASRTSWPISVYLKDLGSKDGDYVSSNLGLNSDWIELNTKNLAAQSTMRITAGHEFFHFAQACYQSKPRNLWLDEATATWFEKTMSGESNYVPRAFSGNPRMPLRGMHVEPRLKKTLTWNPSRWFEWETAEAQYRGYGLAAWIEFLSQQPWWTPGYLRTLYTEIANGTHPVAAMVGTLGSPENARLLWRDFVRAFFSNELYPLEARELARLLVDSDTAYAKSLEGPYGRALSPRVAVMEDVARLQQFDLSIQQLGARTIRYQFDATDMLPDEATFASELETSSSGDLAHLDLMGVLLLSGTEPGSWSLYPVAGVVSTLTARSTVRLDMSFDRPQGKCMFMVAALNTSVSDPYDQRIPVTWRTFMTTYPFGAFSVHANILGTGSSTPTAVLKVHEMLLHGDLGTVTTIEQPSGDIMDGEKGITVKLPHNAATNLTVIVDADFEPPLTREIPDVDGTWIVVWQEDLGWRLWSNMGENTTAGPYVSAVEAKTTGLTLACPAPSATAFHTVVRGFRAHVYWQPEGFLSPSPNYTVADWDIGALFVDIIGSEAPIP
jgi:hypothetical protein